MSATTITLDKSYTNELSWARRHFDFRWMFAPSFPLLANRLPPCNPTADFFLSHRQTSCPFYHLSAGKACIVSSALPSGFALCMPNTFSADSCNSFFFVPKCVEFPWIKVVAISKFTADRKIFAQRFSGQVQKSHHIFPLWTFRTAQDSISMYLLLHPLLLLQNVYSSP